MAPYGAKPVVADGGCPRYTARPEHVSPPVNLRRSINATPTVLRWQPTPTTLMPRLAAARDAAAHWQRLWPVPPLSQARQADTEPEVPARGPPALAPGRALSEAGPLSGKPPCRRGLWPGLAEGS